MSSSTPQELQKELQRQLEKTEGALREHNEDAAKFLSKDPLTGTRADLASEMIRRHEQLQAELDDLREKLRTA